METRGLMSPAEVCGLEATGRLVAEGRSVQVMYDYESRQSVPPDDGTRGAMAAMEEVTLAQLLDPTGNYQLGPRKLATRRWRFFVPR